MSKSTPKSMVHKVLLLLLALVLALGVLPGFIGTEHAYADDDEVDSPFGIDLGSYTIDLTKGSKTISGETVGGFQNWWEESYYFDRAIERKVNSESSIDLDFDMDGTGDVRLDLSVSGKIMIKELATNSILGSYTRKLTEEANADLNAMGENFYSQVTIKFAPRSLAKATVSGIKASYPWTGKEIKPVPALKLTLGAKTVSLKSGSDYTVSYRNNINVGTATITFTGKGNFTGTVEKTFKITAENVKPGFLRLSGDNRYKTAYAIADQLKKDYGVAQFTSACIADGRNYPDALAGAYLAKVKKCPILVTHPSLFAETVAYVKGNVKKGATVYILGGTGSVPNGIVTQLQAAGFKVKRLGGANRYDTNLLILKEAGGKNQDLLVTTGQDFSDALVASATGKPVLLTYGSALTTDQKAYVAAAQVKSITAIGNNALVSAGVVNDLKKYKVVTRVSGTTVYDRSLNIAKKFFPGNQPHINLADGRNFPDALCGGPLASKEGGPLFLTDGSATVNAKIRTYAKAAKSVKATVYGGPASVSDATVKYILSMN